MLGGGGSRTSQGRGAATKVAPKLAPPPPLALGGGNFQVHYSATINAQSIPTATSPTSRRLHLHKLLLQPGAAPIYLRLIGRCEVSSHLALNELAKWLTERSLSARANWGLAQGSLNIHGHKSSIIRTYLFLCRNARSTILLTMFSLPFLSRRACDQVVHRRCNPLCLVTALLSTSQPSLRRLSSSV